MQSQPADSSTRAQPTNQHSAQAAQLSNAYPPGTMVKIRDEEWLVESLREDEGMTWLTVRGLRGLVQDTTAVFSPDLDTIERIAPENTEVVADDSPHYRRSKLWLDAILRKSPKPLRDASITVAKEGMVNALDYQLEAVRKAISDENPRCRILLADSVGLGKTIEIGMILSELIRRGKGDRILVVAPRHVLEQMQLELWTRFSLPFVRLDSAGIQRVRQKIPANRNPFTYYPRAIVSIDTLKSDLYVHQIERQHWDAVVIDESHNLSNAATLNNRLARGLAKNTDALILASATPHNGRAESFAELLSLLDPTAVTPDGHVIPDEVDRLVIRRHRHSPSVAQEVGSDWAERKEPSAIPVTPNMAEDEVATELSQVWLRPPGGRTPLGEVNGAEALFPWTLAKAFLSSPAALLETVRGRKERAAESGKLTPGEASALDRLEDLTKQALNEPNAKFGELVRYLKQIGVSKSSDTRAVIFAERVATLKWLRDSLPKAMGMPKGAFELMYGGLDDIEQQKVVEDFSRQSSPVRVLITGDVASEGVNLHRQCHNLIHYELPWSLIRIEQRNGRIDRYGQKHSPQIAMMVMEPSDPGFSGDVRILRSLIEREHEAHKTLGEASSLMGKYSVAAEEDEIRRVLSGRGQLDDVVHSVDDVRSGEVDEVAALLSHWFDEFEDDSVQAEDGDLDSGNSATSSEARSQRSQSSAEGTLYPDQITFLKEALDESGAARLDYDPSFAIAKFAPPADLAQRFSVLPQQYLKDRRVIEETVLATTKIRGEDRLVAARTDQSGSSWPDASYLAPLHPVLEWATDRALASLGRGKIFAVRGDVQNPTALMLTTLLNTSGSVAAESWIGVEFPDLDNPSLSYTYPYDSPQEALSELGLNQQSDNPGPTANTTRLQKLIVPAVEKAESWAGTVFQAQQEAAAKEQRRWEERTSQWDYDAKALIQRSELRDRRHAVNDLSEYLKTLAPSRRLVSPVLVVVPKSWPVDQRGVPPTQSADTLTQYQPLSTQSQDDQVEAQR